MSFLPLSYSTTSLSTANSGCFTGASDSTGYTSDGRRDSFYCGRGNPSGREDVDERVDIYEQEDEMEKFLLGPGWRDHRVPPAERLKHLYRLLEEYYDLTGGDYYGQRTHRVCEPSGNFKRATRLEEYPVTCAPYLTSIGVQLDFLEGSNDISSDPMNDLIDDAFCRSTSPYPRYRAGPISTWEIDWNRPLPQATRAYWEIMCRTRTKRAHEFSKAKPVTEPYRVLPQPRFPRGDFPRYDDSMENVHGVGRFRVVLHKVCGLVTSH